MSIYPREKQKEFLLFFLPENSAEVEQEHRTSYSGNYVEPTEWIGSPGDQKQKQTRRIQSFR